MTNKTKIYSFSFLCTISHSTQMAPIECNSCILPQCDHKYKHPAVDVRNRNSLNQSICLWCRRHRWPKCNNDALHGDRRCMEELHRWASLLLHRSLSSLRTPTACDHDRNYTSVPIDRRSVVRAMVVVSLALQLCRRMALEWSPVSAEWHWKCVGRCRRSAADSAA